MLKAAIVALALAPLSAEAVTYRFAFERYQAETLVAWPESGIMDGSGPYIAQRGAGAAEYEPTDIIFGFDHEDSLDGLAFDLADMNAPGGWAIGARGTVAFTGDSLSGWELIADFGDGISEHHTSDPLDFSWIESEVLNSELLPIMHYGATRYEPNIYEFALAPGRWVCWADGQPCDASQPAEVAVNPIPAPLVLLLSGIAGLVLVRRSSQP